MQQKHRTNYRKFIAAFMLTIMSADLLIPNVAYALTSGPAAPETASFQYAGATDMVDLFSGNFNYNLPVMDVDGYPINLTYGSGSGIDDEASWVGCGWNLQVGSVTRTLRGLPDDMSGDRFETEHYTKPKVTVGGRLTAKMEIAGKATDRIRLTGSFTLGVFSDSYTGIGAELGANAGLSYDFASGGAMTAGLGIGLLSSTQTGVDVTPTLSLSYNDKVNRNLTSRYGVSATLGYNTRAGLKDLTLGSSFSMTAYEYEQKSKLEMQRSSGWDIAGSTITYNTEPINPEIQVPYTSNHESFSFDVGGLAWLFFTGVGATGYRTTRKVTNRVFSNPAFGFLYAERGKNNPSALMDMQREKESMIMPELPNIAVPIHTPDLFFFTSQAGSGQFRLYRGGTGILFDNEAKDASYENTAGFDAGVGGYAHGGVSLYTNTTKNITKKWTEQNSFMQHADFQDTSSKKLDSEHAYFKIVGEKNQEDEDIANKLVNTEPIAVNLGGNAALKTWRKSDGTTQAISEDIVRSERTKRRQSITHLTAEEASRAGLDKTIRYYGFNNFTSCESGFTPQNCHALPNSNSVNRFETGVTYTENGQTVSNLYRKKHHISEITVTDEGGKRNVYGLPVYNASQTEYSFAIGKPSTYTRSGQSQDVNEKNLVQIDPAGTNGIQQDLDKDHDHYYHREKQPGYATSYLLTGILSPDYVDITNNGITDDDPGTAIKFNYSKLPGLYKWRTPYNKDTLIPRGTISKGLLANPDDDKGSVIIGERELWYIHSIETKTKIAYFITQDRFDGLGVTGLMGKPDRFNRQKVLREIRLYSKADITRPIKVVKFNYDYSIGKNYPNHIRTEQFLNPDCSSRLNTLDMNKGKLTLKSVVFLYGNSPKGNAHPYIFHYNNTESNNQVEYGYLLTDRWGTYKPNTANQTNPLNPLQLRNDEFPYTSQDDPRVDEWAAIGQLSKIELPTGGEITVHYESDDYAYVQNKKAMQMVKVEGLINQLYQPASSLRTARGFKFKIKDLTGTSTDFKDILIQKYLNGSEYIYTKFFVDVAGYDSRNKTPHDSYYDFIPCYAKVTGARHDGEMVSVQLEEINESEITNPIQIAAWQKMKLEYPRYAYPGYKNRIDHTTSSGKALKAALGAIVDAARTLDELNRNFYNRASDLHFAQNVKLDKSFIRIGMHTLKKKGGGVRVKKLIISDQWQAMTGDNGITKQYGQSYDYTMQDNAGNIISSGVASFEPGIGNDENPLRLPVPYVQKIKGALNNFYQLEEPFGESLFPAASVGYRRVTIRDLDENGNISTSIETGSVVHEFYTSKEFPVITRATSNRVMQYGPSGWYSLFGSSSFHQLIFSQGYSVELNDMHGKPKASRVFNKGGAEVTSTEYQYNAEPYNPGEFRLKNEVSVADETGVVNLKKIIGREIEVFTDMREQESNSTGHMVASGVDIFPIPIISAPGALPHWPYKANDSHKLFRSASTLKVIQYYGVIEKVIKRVDGSSVSSENLVYDAVTGDPVVTRTYNEFERPIYSVNIPAYWTNKGMGAAYKTAGTFIAPFEVKADGTYDDVTYKDFLYPGDQLVNMADGKRMWILESALNGTGTPARRVIDEAGHVVAPSVMKVKVLRSGYRNSLSASATSIVCQKDPIVMTGANTGLITFRGNADKAEWQVLSASAVIFDDYWGMKNECATCPPGYQLLADGNTCEQVLEEPSTTLCHTLCTGPLSTLFHEKGARIVDNENGGTVYTLMNDYYGGACFNCEALVTPPPVTPNNSGPVPLVSSNCADNNKTPNNTCSGNYCGKLNKIGVWLCTHAANSTTWPPYDEWVGIETCIDFPTTGWYFFGFAADDNIKIYMDGNLLFGLPFNDTDNFLYYHVRSANVTAGKHKMLILFHNNIGGGSVGMEVYKETLTNMRNPANINPANIIFSTKDLLGKNNVQVFRQMTSSGTGGIPRFKVGNELPDVCNLQRPVDRVINPYVKGFKGNFRPRLAKAYLENRQYKDIINQQNPQKEVDIKNAGNLKSFVPFWFYGNNKWDTLPSSDKWITTNTITLYDKYGQELENLDALHRYSGASFVFNGQLPGAVGSNAMQRELFYESFEDLKFRENCVSPESSCNLTGFRQTTAERPVPTLNATIKHTGNYSAQLPTNGLSILTNAHSKQTKEVSYYNPNGKGEMQLPLASASKGIFPNGFEPFTPASGQKEYIISLWVYDNQPLTLTPGISLTVNGQNITMERKAVVEKWKLVEGRFVAGAGTYPFEILLKPNGASDVKVDDIRIHPFDAHLKSYAYDEKTLRLMAEMDENNFATFYEYDDEGGLVRLKKETDRGILTIKENRSAQKKKPY